MSAPTPTPTPRPVEDCFASQQAALTALILRQTDYTETQANEKLKEHHYDVNAVIREYLSPGPNKVQVSIPTVSTNQQIYKQIRGLMDDAAMTYEKTKKKCE